MMEPGRTFGDHPEGYGEWLDATTESAVRCPACQEHLALRRFRAAYGGGFPLHMHEVVACPECDRLSVVCYPPVPQPDLPPGVTSLPDG